MSGYLNDYLSAALDSTDGPQIYHIWGGYMTVASYMAKRVWVQRGFEKIYPNLYCVLIGESTVFRKTTALRFSRRIIQYLAPQLVMADDFSYEGLFNSLCETGAGTLYFEEFENLMSKVSRESMSQLKGFLTSAYDVPPSLKKSLVRDRKKKDVEADLQGKKTEETKVQEPYLCIFSATTLEWMTKRLTEDDFRSGFMARWIFIPASWDDVRPEMPHPPALPLERLQAIQESIKLMGNLHGELVIADQPDYDEYYYEFSSLYTPREEGSPVDKVLGPYFDRLKTVALKLSMIHHIIKCDGTNAIQPDSIEFGWKCAAWLARQVIKLKGQMAFSDNHRNYMRVTELLSEGPKTRSQLYRAINMKGYELGNLLSNLESDRVIRCETAEPEGDGRRGKTIYSLIEANALVAQNGHGL